MEWKEKLYCGDLSASHQDQDVLLMGWVDAIRDHGNVMFIHLRDIRGIVQVVFDPLINNKCYAVAASLKEEYVVKIRGRVSVRKKGAENPNIETGNIEIIADELDIFSSSRRLPFKISEKAMLSGDETKAGPENVEEELRLKYRYLDLRRPSMQAIFINRYRIIKRIREYFDNQNFIEIETPFLTRSTPEGARDYLVPSRVRQGSFYALPQSPQLFKQLLMMSGMDRYFQIARCFRDEDLRPNRQPEFTQLDLEASFIDEEFIYELIEDLLVRIFTLGGITLERPFPRMTYAEAMDCYGTDRPDLRFDLRFEDITDIVKNTGYSIFKKVIAGGGKIKGFCVKGQAGVLSKNVLQNEYALKIAPDFGARGMTWMKVADGKLQSNIVQFFNPVEQADLIKRFKAGEGDVLMMIADQSIDLINKVLCSLRLHVANRLDLIPRDSYCPLWVTNFPLFELKDGQIRSQHHPFTMPDRSIFNPADTEDLLSLNSRAYDIVMNGEELGGGSVRIHNMDIQSRIFKALGLSSEEARDKFGFFLAALEFGAPPHAGLALGLDRTISMILQTSSIRDVITFPKNRSAVCPLTAAPSKTDQKQLEDLGLSLMTDSEPFNPAELSDKGSGPRDLKQPERITKDQVRHVAKLACLKLSDAELEPYQNELNSILKYVETLNELNTDDVEPMSQVLKNRNVWRDDSPGKEKDRESLLTNAPEREGDYFKVPRILEG
jgi:aspartyl-tRNA synthetase